MSKCCMKQGRLGIVYLVVETSLPANKKSPHTPTTPTPTPTSASTSRRFLTKDQAEGWTGVFETEYME